VIIKIDYGKKIYLSYLILATFLLFGCSGQPIGTGGNSTGSGSLRVQGSGASFPKPIYEKWMSEYGKLNPNAKFDYQSTGSGAGINAIITETADFGASDAPMSEEELKKAPSEILHIPTVLGAVVLTYNLESVSEPLKLSGETVADIFLGKIKKWNDPKIKADNANLNLPDKNITVIYRNDASGTTDVFTDYLSKISPEWKEKVGRNKNIKLPEGVGSGAPRNDGVMGQIKQTPNSIGYVELTFAKAQNLPVAFIKNKVGKFIEPSPETVTSAAAASIGAMPADLRAEITNADGENSYPISSYTYILIYKEQKDAVKGKAIVDFLWWATHDGAKFTKDLHYAALPDEIVKKVEAKLQSVTNGGQVLRK
jgi:phosphate transport system substrate-binding protein